MALQIHKNHIKRRSRRAEKPKETVVYPEASQRTDSGFTISGYKGAFETSSERVTAGGVSTIRCHDGMPRVYRVENGYCLFIMIDKSTGEKTEVIGSPSKEILVPKGFAHYFKGHVDLDTNLYVVQEKNFLDEFVEEANVDKVTPFAEAIHNYTPDAPAPRKKRPKKSKAAEQNRKFSASKGHVSVDNAADSGLDGMMKAAADPNFKVDNQRPTVLSGRDMGIGQG